MVWKPHVTVAAVIERDGKFLLVEEETDSGIRYNQPAGHLECREALTDAVSREVLEETAYRFVPKYLVGVYNWRNEEKDLTYLRFTFGGDIAGHDAGRPLDEGIIAAHWLTLDEIQASEMRYLTQCEINGVILTDLKYFFIILKNILFKKARSA